VSESSGSDGARVVGIDLGGTKVAAMLLRGRSVSEPVQQSTETSNTEKLLDQLVELAQRATDGQQLDGVGIGVPSVVEFASGRVIASVNIPLKDVPLREVLSERLGVPVFVDNDATVAALAEAHDENLELVAHNLVMLTIGTGVGGGIVLGGRIFRGATGGAGELGHTLVAVPVDGEIPEAGSFPQSGSLEAAAAGHALDRMAAAAAAAKPDSALGRRLAGGQRVLGTDAVDAAHAGDETALTVVRCWAERVGVGIANVINTFDPNEVVIGGGAARAGQLLLEPAAHVARQYVVPGLGTNTNIRLARQGASAGCLGAALLALHELEDRAPVKEGMTG